MARGVVAGGAVAFGVAPTCGSEVPASLKLAREVVVVRFPDVAVAVS